jgi:mono/diheme cytochrome c family protein
VNKLIGSLAVGVLATAAGANPPGYANPAVAAVVPVYAAVHSPQTGGDDETKELLRQILGELKKLNALAAQPVEPVTPAVTDALAVARRSCLGCHGPAAAAEKGGEFVLFGDEGGTQFAPLNPRDRRRISDRVSNGSMPPPKAGKLSNPDKAAVADHFRK